MPSSINVSFVPLFAEIASTATANLRTLFNQARNDINRLEAASVVNVTAATALTVAEDRHVTAFDIATTGSTSYAVTLAPPTAAQRGKIAMLVMTARPGTGNVTIAGTNIRNVTGTGTFDAVGDTLLLIGGPTHWHILENSNVTFA